MLSLPIQLAIACTLFGPTEFQSRELAKASRNSVGVELIRPSQDGSYFVRAASGERFLVWGLNYDHDAGGRLIEEYWHDEWGAVVRHFYEMKTLGANVVRIHLQLSAFMKSATEPNEVELARLKQLLNVAEQAGLYLNVTGLGCYHKQAVPPWYDALGEAERWAVQTRFWEAVAQTCAESEAVFCYNLMNEPILPGGEKKETEWLAGELGGKHFVQRIALDLAGRSRTEVAKAWVDLLVAAIRKHDQRHMITVGVIPWAHAFPKAKPLFYSAEAGEKLDFVSVHFYPEKGEVEKALAALRVYRVGKPLVVEELFPLRCGMEDLNAFIDGSREFTDGWIGFYWGRTIDEYAQNDFGMAGAITKAWLEYFRDKGPEILQPQPQTPK
ncbi:MAG: cellulase family glycosylhydrolase [Patescibacteria group bacterium]|nr:cellulase family glycosylhydrolase [Patescibacteria group bacterium]